MQEKSIFRYVPSPHQVILLWRRTQHGLNQVQILRFAAEVMPPVIAREHHPENRASLFNASHYNSRKHFFMKQLNIISSDK